MHLKEMYFRFGGSKKLLSHNESELKNTLLSEIASQLGIKHIHSSQYKPQANGMILASHYFLKNCIIKFTKKVK